MNSFSRFRLFRAAIAWVAVGLVTPLRGVDATDVLSSASGSVVALAVGLEPDRAGTGERLVVVTSGWTDLEQSVASGSWQAAPAREILWDEGGVVGAVSWDTVDYDPAATSSFLVRPAQLGSARTVHFVNVSGRAGLRHVNGSVITGFAFAEGTKRFLVRAAGPALVPFQVGGAMVNPTVTLYDGNRQPVATADDWDVAGAGDTIAQAAAGLGAFPFARGSADAALLVDLPAGTYTVVVGSQAGDEGVTLAEAYEVPAAGSTSALLNLSLRARVEAGARVAIPGFVTQGDSNRRYLIRVVGPGLIPHGVPAPLPDPRLTIYQGNQPVAANDNWGQSLAANVIAQAATQVGAFTLNPAGLDSAVLMALPPGLFTVVVEDATGAGAFGEVLVEVYLVPAG